VLFVTHDQEEALFMGDRVAILNAGHLEQVGTPQEVFGAPATRFVAEFLGIPDFLPAQVTPQGLVTELGLAQPQAKVSLPLGTRVDVLVRPDDLTLHPDPQGEAHIVRSIFRGMDYLHQVALPSGHEVRCFGPHTACHAPGTRVRVELTPGHALNWYIDGLESEAISRRSTVTLEGQPEAIGRRDANGQRWSRFGRHGSR
jgi:iron(III) transport system ATP-binding protein